MILSASYHQNDETAVLQETEPLHNFKTEINKLASNRIPFFFLIDFEMKKPVVCRFEEAAGNGIFFNFRSITNCDNLTDKNLKYSSEDIHLLKRMPVSMEAYTQAFTLMQDNLHAGNTYLINLTFASEIKLGCSLADIFNTASAKYKLLYKDQFVQFSPETFIRIENGIISSCPMKGTIDASIPDAEAVILADQKECWEHNTIVDLIRNDLSIVSEGVRVNKFRYIDRLKSREKELLQVSSEITGKLTDDWHDRLGDILLNLLPAGSISGAPKKKTVEVIGDAEKGKRGYYTGVSGISNGDSLDSAVNIRFIEKSGEKYYFRSGGGITSSSNLESEYREMIDKVNVPSNS